MKVMVFIELADNATFDGVPIEQAQDAMGAGLTAWLGSHVTSPGEDSIACQFNMMVAANKIMKDSLKGIVEANDEAQMRTIARRALGLVS